MSSVDWLSFSSSPCRRNKETRERSATSEFHTKPSRRFPFQLNESRLHGRLQPLLHKCTTKIIVLVWALGRNQGGEGLFTAAIHPAAGTRQQAVALFLYFDPILEKYPHLMGEKIKCFKSGCAWALVNCYFHFWSAVDCFHSSEKSKLKNAKHDKIKYPNSKISWVLFLRSTANIFSTA